MGLISSRGDVPDEAAQPDSNVSHRTDRALDAVLASADLPLKYMGLRVLRSSMDTIRARAWMTSRSAGKALSTTG
ncbi:hypothetical protein BE15_17150 [Sorangium cellulosum]|uniref:Uncharacterized protein n=1 Tax=Sorangium cellulosum TaxID=56 RepID=A0A150QWU0_SORCE|nr:hypothetical protein BE15_17150 [Sorangium cellulosum]